MTKKVMDTNLPDPDVVNNHDNSRKLLNKLARWLFFNVLLTLLPLVFTYIGFLL